MEDAELARAGYPSVSTEDKARAIDRVDMLRQVRLHLEAQIEQAQKYFSSKPEETGNDNV